MCADERPIRAHKHTRTLRCYPSVPNQTRLAHTTHVTRTTPLPHLVFRPKALVRVLPRPLRFVARDVFAELVLGDLGLAAFAAVLVLRGDHLLDVLHLELDLGLIGPGRLPVEQ